MPATVWPLRSDGPAREIAMADEAVRLGDLVPDVRQLTVARMPRVVYGAADPKAGAAATGKPTNCGAG